MAPVHSTGASDLGRALLRLDSGGQTTESARWSMALAIALYAEDEAQASQIVSAARQQMPTVSVLDDVLAPALHRIGSLWQHDEITIADEHRATAFAHALLEDLAGSLELTPAGSRATVLLAAPAQETHTLGLRMARDVLAGAGYSTVLLAAGTTDAALLAALTSRRPSLVALSTTMRHPQALAATAHIVNSTLPDTPLIVGGAAGGALPSYVRACYVERLDALLETVHEVLLKCEPARLTL